jgi:hypothetical protein
MARNRATRQLIHPCQQEGKMKRRFASRFFNFPLFLPFSLSFPSPPSVFFPSFFGPSASEFLEL